MDGSELIQGGEDWLQIRCGKVTASRVSDVIATTKTGYGASRANYMAELIAERLTGATSEKFSNAAMAWGTATEDEARAAYEFQFGVCVETVGFVAHPTLADCGASPDGYVGDDGLVEIKCPNTATHIDTLLGQAIPAKYATQMLWQMECTGRAWCDFVSYDPRLPASMQLFVKRLERDDERLDKVRGEVVKFLDELASKENSLRAIYEKAAA
jgi:putative phage-type endonuclease